MKGRSVSVTEAPPGRRHAAARPRRPVPEPSSRIFSAGRGAGVVVKRWERGGEEAMDGRSCARMYEDVQVLRPRASPVRGGSRMERVNVGKGHWRVISPIANGGVGG